MSPVCLRSRRGVTLVGGAPLGPDDLTAALALAPGLVAADGGLGHLTRAGLDPEAVIGDLDSADPERLAALAARTHHVAEQDSTDLEKCLRRIEAPLVIGIGFLGGRLDHHLAAMTALVTFRAQPLILLGESDLCFHCPEELTLRLPAGTRVSLFPMAPVTGRISEGLRWSVAGLALSPDGRIGTSNEALGGPVRLGFDAPGALVILPRRWLGQVAEILAPDAV